MKLKSMIMSLLMLCIGFTVYSQASNEKNIPIEESVAQATDMDVMTQDVYSNVDAIADHLTDDVLYINGDPLGLTDIEISDALYLPRVSDVYTVRPLNIKTTEYQTDSWQIPRPDLSQDNNDLGDHPKIEFHEVLKPPVL